MGQASMQVFRLFGHVFLYALIDWSIIDLDRLVNNLIYYLVMDTRPNTYRDETEPHQNRLQTEASF